MTKLLATVFFSVSICLVPACVAQSSSDGFFTVRHAKKPGFALSAAQMRQAEKLYQSACAVVQRDFRGAGELHPRFTLVVGAERNAVYGRNEVWLKEWNPAIFTEGVIVLAFDQVLTGAMTTQMARRALQYANAAIDVNDLKDNH